MGSREGCSSSSSIVQAAFGHAPETWPTSSEGASLVPASFIEVSTQNERFIMPPEIFDEDEKKYVASQSALTGWICDFDVGLNSFQVFLFCFCRIVTVPPADNARVLASTPGAISLGALAVSWRWNSGGVANLFKDIEYREREQVQIACLETRRLDLVEEGATYQRQLVHVCRFRDILRSMPFDPWAAQTFVPYDHLVPAYLKWWKKVL